MLMQAEVTGTDKLLAPSEISDFIRLIYVKKTISLSALEADVYSSSQTRFSMINMLSYVAPLYKFKFLLSPIFLHYKIDPKSN